MKIKDYIKNGKSEEAKGYLLSRQDDIICDFGYDSQERIEYDNTEMNENIIKRLEYLTEKYYYSMLSSDIDIIIDSLRTDKDVEEMITKE